MADQTQDSTLSGEFSSEISESAGGSTTIEQRSTRLDPIAVKNGDDTLSINNERFGGQKDGVYIGVDGTFTYSTRKYSGVVGSAGAISGSLTINDGFVGVKAYLTFRGATTPVTPTMSIYWSPKYPNYSKYGMELTYHTNVGVTADSKNLIGGDSAFKFTATSSIASGSDMVFFASAVMPAAYYSNTVLPNYAPTMNFSAGIYGVSSGQVTSSTVALYFYRNYITNYTPVGSV